MQRPDFREFAFLLLERLRLELNMLLLDPLVERFGLHQRAQGSVLQLRFLLPPVLDITQPPQLLLYLFFLAAFAFCTECFLFLLEVVLSLLLIALFQSSSLLFFVLQLLVSSGELSHKLFVLLLSEFYLWRAFCFLGEDLEAVLEHTQLAL